MCAMRRSHLNLIATNFRSFCRHLFLFFAGTLIPVFSLGQELAIEEELFDCLRWSYTDRDEALDSLIVTFESELIAEGLMRNSSAEEYRGLLQRIASGQPILRGMDSYFFTRFRNMAPDTLSILTCVERMERYVAQNPESRFGQTVALRELAMQENVPPDMQASDFLEILRISDFETPIYRFLTYHIIDGQAYETATSPPTLDDLRRRGLISESGANLFQVYMNTAGQLIVNDQLIPQEELLELVQEHARRFEEEAIYVVEIEDDVKYASYIGLKDQIALAITQVRDNYARRFLGKTLTELNEEERDAVFLRYPIRLVSP